MLNRIFNVGFNLSQANGLNVQLVFAAGAVRWDDKLDNYFFDRGLLKSDQFIPVMVTFRRPFSTQDLAKFGPGVTEMQLDDSILTMKGKIQGIKLRDVASHPDVIRIYHRS